MKTGIECSGSACGRSRRGRAEARQRCGARRSSGAFRLRFPSNLVNLAPATFHAFESLKSGGGPPHSTTLARVRRARRTRAFTLIELVVSASIASMILIGAYMCLGAGIAGQKTIEPRTEVIQNARVALAIISADLRCACALSKDTPFLGLQRTLNGMPAGNLDFGTHNYMPRRPGQADYCQVSYFLDKGTEPGEFSLWRRRNPSMGIDPLSGGKREEIAQGLVGVTFEYYDGYDWYTSWGEMKGDKPDRSASRQASLDSSNLDGMPEAVRVTLYFDSEPKHNVDKQQTETEPEKKPAPPMVFQTTVRLELASVYSSDSSSGSGSSSTSSTQPGVPGVNPQGGN